MSVVAADPAGLAADRGHRNHGGGRRAVIRWGWRLARREWRRHVLILVMLTVAVAATIVGLGTASNASRLKADPVFGTATTIISLRGSDPQLSADIAAIRARVGPVDVVAHQQVAVPGSVSTVDLRDQAPGGTFDRDTLRLDSGRYPTGPGQVAISPDAARLLGLRIGSSWTANGVTRQVVGIVENPLNLLDQFALVAPGQAAPATTVSILTDWQPRPGDHIALPSGTGMGVFSRGHPSTASVDALVLALGAIGLLFVGLMGVAGFTVMAQRRQRALGVLASLGATDRHVRLVMLADGAAVGLAGAVAGGLVGLAAWSALVPGLESVSGHRIDRFALPWWAVGLSLVLAVLTAVAAAWWPARSMARTSIVAALSGRPSRPQPAHRFAAVGALLLGAGLALLYFSDHGSDHHRASFIIAGTLVTPVGLLFLAPLAIRALSAVGHRSGVAVRLALRDLARYQARSGAALGSVTLAIGIAATIAISAAASDAPSPVGNLPSDQLMIYVSPDSGSGQVPPLNGAQIQAVTARINALAGALHARAVVPLEQAYSARAGLQPAQPGNGSRSVPAGYGVAMLSHVSIKPHGTEISGMEPLYVATPDLLGHYGISGSAIDPDADVLSARQDLAGLQIFAPQFQAGPGPQPGSGGPAAQPGSGRPGSGIPDILHVTPKIQAFPQLPLYTSAPGTLLTPGAVQRFGLKEVPAAWWIQASAPLTSQEIQTARTTAASIGLYVETRNRQTSSAPLRNWSTAIGILLSLGVLGMTVGLIRSETAGDLRTLAATGASSYTRRTITGATSGALALLGAVLGTAGAYAALVVWYRSDLNPLGRVPVVNLVLILVGLPVLAGVGGWLLAGREPPTMARQPLE
ncbi:MAG TPA: FtsX-like permease family protein [Acidimicrobiales bacterium]|nr:FtsX-like permease family protein [Acidimicrobiales bacterium]